MSRYPKNPTGRGGDHSGEMCRDCFNDVTVHHSPLCNPCRRKREKRNRIAQGLTSEPRKLIKTNLVANRRQDARQRGIEFTITADDLIWPEYCPVLGTKLDYTKVGHRQGISHKNLPSLDRWDNAKGYVPGNVYVISLRANELKRDSHFDEMKRVLSYMEDPGIPKDYTRAQDQKWRAGTRWS